MGAEESNTLMALKEEKKKLKEEIKQLEKSLKKTKNALLIIEKNKSEEKLKQIKSYIKKIENHEPVDFYEVQFDIKGTDEQNKNKEKKEEKPKEILSKISKEEKKENINNVLTLVRKNTHIIIEDNDNKTKIIWIDENIENHTLIEKNDETLIIPCDSLLHAFKQIMNIKFHTYYVIISADLFPNYIQNLECRLNELISIPISIIYCPNEKNENKLLNSNVKKFINHKFFNPAGIKKNVAEIMEFINDFNKKINFINNNNNEKEVLINPQYFIYNKYLAIKKFAKIKFNELKNKDKKDLIKNLIEKHIYENNKILLNSLFNLDEIPEILFTKYLLRIISVNSNLLKDISYYLLKEEGSSYNTFIKFLYNSISENIINGLDIKNKNNNLIVFRGCVFNFKEFSTLINVFKTENKIIYSKTFLTTSKEEKISFDVMKKKYENNNSTIPILFEIHFNNENNDKIFAFDLEDYSITNEQKQVIFLPFNGFHIEKIEDFEKDEIKLKKIIMIYNGEFKEK